MTSGYWQACWSTGWAPYLRCGHCWKPARWLTPPHFGARAWWTRAAPTFAGIYAGAASSETVRHVVEDAPVLILAGVQFTDLNSGFFTQQIHRTRTIEMGPRRPAWGQPSFLRSLLRTRWRR